MLAEDRTTEADRELIMEGLSHVTVVTEFVSLNKHFLSSSQEASRQAEEAHLR